MHYRSAVLVVIVVSLTLGAPLQAQTTFVSPGAAAGAAAVKAIREAAARQEDQRRQEERERIARERLALEERRVALQEQLIAEEAAIAKEEQAELPAATPAPEPTPVPIPPNLRDAAAFALWNKCAPIRLFVAELDDEAAAIDLTKERIQTLAESRLRAARLYDAAALPYLFVRVGVLVSENRRGGAYSIEVLFKKYLRDVVADQNGFAATWDTGGFGTHSGNAGFVLQAVSEDLDNFVLEYLRVNETACG